MPRVEKPSAETIRKARKLAHENGLRPIVILALIDHKELQSPGQRAQYLDYLSETSTSKVGW